MLGWHPPCWENPRILFPHSLPNPGGERPGARTPGLATPLTDAIATGGGFESPWVLVVLVWALRTGGLRTGSSRPAG